MASQNFIENYEDPNGLTEDDLISMIDGEEPGPEYYAGLSPQAAQQLICKVLDDYLDPRYSELLKAKFFGDCDNESISSLTKITGVSYKNTHKRYYQALEAFKEVVKKEFPDIWIVLQTPALKLPGPAKGSKHKPKEIVNE